MSHRRKNRERIKRMMESQEQRYDQDDIRHMVLQSPDGEVELTIESITEDNQERIFRHLFPETCPVCREKLLYIDRGYATEISCPACQKVLSYIQRGP